MSFLLSTIFMLTATCPQPNLINTTKYPWNDFDKKTLKVASKRCGTKYERSPCVKVFMKRGERAYWVICGQPVFLDSAHTLEFRGSERK